MAKNNNTENVEETIAPIVTKEVRNMSRGKIELHVYGQLVVILPGETIQLPEDFQLPVGIGLMRR